jgi:hypothetical protein
MDFKNSGQGPPRTGYGGEHLTRGLVGSPDRSAWTWRTVAYRRPYRPVPMVGPVPIPPTAPIAPVPPPD